MSDKPTPVAVARKVHETGLRLPDGRVVTGANIPDVRIPGEVVVTRIRTVYADDLTDWKSAAELQSALDFEVTA